MSSNAIQRAFGITELLVLVLEFVGSSRSHSDETSGNKSETIDFETSAEIIRCYIDIWVRCRSVSRYWKLVIEGEPNFRAFSWRGNQLRVDKKPIFCYPAFAWLGKSLIHLGWGHSAYIVKDHGLLRELLKRDCFSGQYATEPPVSTLMIRFYGFNIRPDEIPRGLRPVTVSTSMLVQKDSFLIINPTGVRVWDVLEPIIDVVTRFSFINGYNALYHIKIASVIEECRIPVGDGSESLLQFKLDRYIKVFAGNGLLTLNDVTRRSYIELPRPRESSIRNG